MDLPSCPACGQSVLDDDAVDCPFCGASMSGKPKAVAAPSKTATAEPSPASTPNGPASTTTASKSRPTKPAEKQPSGGADDPFEFERKSEAKSIRLRPKPSPGRRHEVICPMCETTGYTARKAAGLSVHCANPTCQLPVFKAPPLSAEQLAEEAAATAEPAPEGRKLWTPVNIVTIIVLVAVSGWAFWFFAWRKPTRKAPPIASNDPGASGQVDPSLIKTVKSSDGPKTKKVAVADPKAEFQKFRSSVLTRMLRHVELVEVAVVKPTAWQMTIDAHVQAGDLKTAADKLDALRVVSQGIEFLEIPALMTLTWGHLQQSDADSAKDYLKKASAKLASLPKRGRQRYDLAVEVAAAFIAMNQSPAAEKVLQQFESGGDAEERQLSLLMQWVRHVFDGDAGVTVVQRPFYTAEHPLRVAVIIQLAAHGKWKAAWNWANSLQSGTAKQECQAVWGELQERLGKATGVDKEIPDRAVIASQLSPALKTMMLARIAAILKNKGQDQAAATVFASAQSTLKSIAIPKAPAVPGFQAVIDGAAPTATDLQQRLQWADAFAELANASMSLNPADHDAAWGLLGKSAALLRSLAPPLPSVTKLVDQTRVPNDRDTRVAMAAELELKGNAEIDRKFRAYRTGLSNLESASQQRSRSLRQLFTRFAERKNAGISSRIWSEITVRSSEKNSADYEDWSSTPIPNKLAVSLKEGGDESTANTIIKHIRENRWSPEPLSNRWLAYWTFAMTGLPDKAIANAATGFSDPSLNKIDSAERHVMAFRIAGNAVTSGNLKTACDFARRLREPILRLEVFNLLGQQAATQGRSEALWTLIQEQHFRPEETVAICHGLITGLKPPADKPQPKTTASLSRR